MAIGTTAAILGSAIIGAGGSFLAGREQSKAAKNAANAQTSANKDNIAYQERIFEQQRADQEPWREAGELALDQILAGIKDGSFDPSNFVFEEDPGYQFRKAEGQKALDRRQLAGGNFMSGQGIKESERYNQNFASDEYDRAYARAAGAKTTNFNQLSAVARTGQIANDSVTASRDRMGSRVGQSYLNSGNAMASGYLRAGEAQASMYSNIAGSANQGIENYLTYSGIG